MNITARKIIAEKKNPVATYADSAFSGIAIYDVIYDIDDYIVCEEICGSQKIPHKLKIYYTSRNGVPYFKLGGRRYKLDEFMRVGF
jgi:hypothetical protein